MTLAPTDIQNDTGCPADTGASLTEAVISELRQAVEAFVSLDSLPGDYPSLQETVVSSIQRMVDAIRRCEETGIEPQEIKKHLTPARLIHHRSAFVSRAQDWPRGYAGDFETIEYLCDGTNRVSAVDAVGHCIEDYTLKARICEQHRIKVLLQADIMFGYCLSKKGARILSIGCGGARDLRLIADLLHDKEAEFVLCDSDAAALELARAELSSLGERCTFVHGKVPRVTNRLKALGKFDLVVAGGLFDYLPDRWIELMVGEIWRHLLRAEGTLFFTNIAVNNPYRIWMEYLADWSLIERSEDDIERLCRNAGVEDGAVTVIRDGTKLTLIAKVLKPENGID